MKGLLAAGMEKKASREDYAKAWPSAKRKGDYKMLARHNERSAEMEMSRTFTGERGDGNYRLLKQFADSSDASTKQLSATKVEERHDGRELGAPLDDTIKRTLFASSTNEEVDVLFRNQLLETIMEGSRRRQIARDVSNIINPDTLSGEVTIAQDDQSGRRTAEGAEIRDDAEDYTTISWDTTKVSQGSRVTDEMVDHAMIDLVERELQYVGRSVENSINEVFLTNAVDDAVTNGSTVTFDSSQSDPGYQALNSLYGQIDREDFRPDTFITTPGYRTETFSNDALRFANRSGSDDVVRERAFDPLLDMEHVGASLNSYDDTGRNVAGGGSNTWEFVDDSGSVVSDGIGCLELDTEHNHLFLYNPDGGGDISVKDYDDPIRDLRGFNARVYVDQDYSQARSAGVIQQPT
jgi:hypothetical protein